MTLWASGAFSGDAGQEADRESTLRELLAHAGVALAPGQSVLHRPEELPTFWLWPENARYFTELWPALQTRWLIGFAGATGMDYAGVDRVIHAQGYRRRKARAAFDAVMVMERAALAGWAELRKKQQQAK